MKRDSAVVICVGLNHATAPVEEREKLAFSTEELPAALADLSARLSGAVLLSTCNRTELYTTAAAGSPDDATFIGLLSAEKSAAIDPGCFYVHRHEKAAGHLFRVAAGLDSMVIGESQILGQVRDAMSAATNAATLNGVLSRLFHSAISVGKRARTQTAIGRQAVSVSSAAVALAERTLGDLSDRTVLVISAGSTGKLAARSLARNDRSRILVANRTHDRAVELARNIGSNASGLSFDGLPAALAEADIVISGTAAEGFLLGPDQVRPAAAARNGRPLLLIDIAVPRDIDPAVRAIPGVQLFDIDDIEAVSGDGNARSREVRRAEAIIEEEVAAFMDWWRSLDVVPVIAALRARAETIRERELERALRRLPALDDDARRRIEAMTQAIVKKMLDRPIARLKDGHDAGLYMEALQDLFEVQSGTPARRRES